MALKCGIPLIRNLPFNGSAAHKYTVLRWSSAFTLPRTPGQMFPCSDEWITVSEPIDGADVTIRCPFHYVRAQSCVMLSKSLDKAFASKSPNEPLR